jgi:hypothetical protein
MGVGAEVGRNDGSGVGLGDGMGVGALVGVVDGLAVGELLGNPDGLVVGSTGALVGDVAITRSMALDVKAHTKAKKSI